MKKMIALILAWLLALTVVEVSRSRCCDCQIILDDPYYFVFEEE